MKNIQQHQFASGIIERREFSLFTCALLLAGCGSTQEQPKAPKLEEVLLDISISADNDANADVKGRGAPLLLRIYELQNDAAFQDADFYALQDHDKATLGTDLLKADQWILKPGETRNIRRKAQPGTTAIALFAAYRDMPQARWRLVHTMPAPVEARWWRALAKPRTIRLAIALQARSPLLTDLDAGPPAQSGR